MAYGLIVSREVGENVNLRKRAVSALLALFAIGGGAYAATFGTSVPVLAEPCLTWLSTR